MLPEITLRPARPTLDDGVAFARYLDMSADGLFRLMFGPGFQQVIAKSFIEPGHDLSFEYVTFAIERGTAVGMMSTYSSQQHGDFSVKPLVRALGWRVVRAGATALLVIRLLRFLDKVPEGSFYLQALATEPVHRGKGIGTMLFERSAIQATENGADQLTLHVAVQNTGARGLYERLGMEVTATSPRYSPLPGVQSYRMVTPIPSR